MKLGIYPIESNHTNFFFLQKFHMVGHTAISFVAVQEIIRYVYLEKLMETQVVELTVDELFESYRRVQLLGKVASNEEDARKLIVSNCNEEWLLAIRFLDKILIAGKISKYKKIQEKSKYKVVY